MCSNAPDVYLVRRARTPVYTNLSACHQNVCFIFEICDLLQPARMRTFNECTEVQGCLKKVCIYKKQNVDADVAICLCSKYRCERM